MRIFKLFIALAIAAPAVAQQPVRPPAAKVLQPVAQDGQIPLDAVVAIVGNQPITRYELREQIIQTIQTGRIQAPTSDSAARALEVATLNEMIENELILQKGKEL